MGFWRARSVPDFRPRLPPSPPPSPPEPEETPDAPLPLPSGASDAPVPLPDVDSELDGLASPTASSASVCFSTDVLPSSSCAGSTDEPLKNPSFFCFPQVDEVEKLDRDTKNGSGRCHGPSACSGELRDRLLARSAFDAESRVDDGACAARAYKDGFRAISRRGTRCRSSIVVAMAQAGSSGSCLEMGYQNGVGERCFVGS